MEYSNMRIYIVILLQRCCTILSGHFTNDQWKHLDHHKNGSCSHIELNQCWEPLRSSSKVNHITCSASASFLLQNGHGPELLRQKRCHLKPPTLPAPSQRNCFVACWQRTVPRMHRQQWIKVSRHTIRGARQQRVFCVLSARSWMNAI